MNHKISFLVLSLSLSIIISKNSYSLTRINFIYNENDLPISIEEVTQVELEQEKEYFMLLSYAEFTEEQINLLEELHSKFMCCAEKCKNLLYILSFNEACTEEDKRKAPTKYFDCKRYMDKSVKAECICQLDDEVPELKKRRDTFKETFEPLLKEIRTSYKGKFTRKCEPVLSKLAKFETKQSN